MCNATTSVRFQFSRSPLSSHGWQWWRGTVVTKISSDSHAVLACSTEILLTATFRMATGSGINCCWFLTQDNVPSISCTNFVFEELEIHSDDPMIRCHITPLLKTLHWLPVRQRIVFKILLIVFKALNGQAPSYILELLTLKSNSHSHNLRSSNDTLLLKMPTCKTKVTLGDRAFSCAAPKIWNNLPLSIRKSQSVTSFKTKLKTHLFVQAFQ